MANHKNRRLQRLSFLGFGSYPSYLSSKIWKSIRVRILIEHPNCIICDEKATIVHHSNYATETLQGLFDEGLHSLCHSSHRTIEWEGNKKIDSLCEVNKRLRRLAKLFGKHVKFADWIKFANRNN